MASLPVKTGKDCGFPQRIAWG